MGGGGGGGGGGGLGVPIGDESSSSSELEVYSASPPESDGRRDEAAEFYHGTLDLVECINGLPGITCEVKSSLIILCVWRLIPRRI